MTNTQFPRFIATSPCGEDLFQSGAQKKTATSIAEHIKNGSSLYRLIGLDGSWGAGKSNVISIIEKELQDTHHVFVYDAWSHQEDLQRRSFLEGLTDDLQANHIIEQKAGKDKLKDLLARKKETTQKSIPKLSLAIIVSLISALLVPVSTIIALGIKDDVYKMLVSSAPVIIALATWGIACIKDKKYRKLSNLFYLYKEKELEVTSTEVISESEPSVREFRNWMSELEHELVTKDLIIVFDNMDRLSAEKVQALWSNIHTFFSENKVNKRIWVIVPFDRLHIKDAFSASEEKADHFINKTYSVIYRVPPAVLTDWWDFFELKFKDAFGEAENPELPIVKGIFDRHQQTITPRKIIAFINELVTLKLTWASEIRLRYMALYLANKTQILGDPVKVIINKEYQSKVAELFSDDEEIDDNIAALVYNVPKAIASQVTLQREIILAIRDKTNERLKELSNHRDFFKILAKVYAKEEMDFVSSVHAIGSLQQKALDEYPKGVLENIWTMLSIKQKSTAIDELSFGTTQQILLTYCPAQARLSLIRYICTQYSISRNFKGEDYFRAISDLDIYIRDKFWDIKLPEVLRETRMQPKDFVSFVLAAKKEYKTLKATCDNLQLEAHLVSEFKTPKPVTDILQYIKADFSFHELTKIVEEELTDEDLNADKLEELVDTYRLLSNDRLLKARISDKLVDEFLSESNENSNRYFELAAMRLARGDDWDGNSEMAIAILDNTNEEEIKEIAARIESYCSFEELLNLTVAWNKPLLNGVMKFLIERSQGVSTASIQKITPLFESIVAVTGVSSEDLFRRLDSWRVDFKKELSTSTLTTMVPDFGLYKAALTIESELSIHLNDTAIRYIDGIEENQWPAYFANEKSYELRLLAFLLKNDFIHSVPEKALASYKSRLEAIAKESEVLPHSIETLDILYSSVDKEQLKDTLLHVRDSFIQSGNINPVLFRLFEKPLRESMVLVLKPTETFNAILTKVIGDRDCFNIIVGNSLYYLSLFSNAGVAQTPFLQAFRKSRAEVTENNGIVFFNSELNGIVAESIKIKEARYFTDDHSVDVTSKMKQIVERERTLQFKIDNGIVDGRDIHPDVAKKFTVKFDYYGTGHEQSYNENDWVSFP